MRDVSLCPQPKACLGLAKGRRIRDGLGNGMGRGLLVLEAALAQAASKGSVGADLMRNKAR